MANTFMTIKEVEDEICKPLAAALRQDIIDNPLKPGERRVYPGLFGCMPFEVTNES